MRTFEEIKGNFIESYEDMERKFNTVEREAQKSREAALRYQRISARKMGEYHKMSHKAWIERDVHWIDDLLKPLLKEVDERTGLNFTSDTFHTYGLRNECPVFAMDGDRVLAYLCFSPGDIKKGELFLDTGDKRGNYPPDSIGALNGFDNTTEEVTSIEVIIENIKRRHPELNIKNYGM